MALPDTQVLQVGTQLVFGDHAGDFVGGAAKTSLEVAGTDVQIATASLADAAGRESAKFDLGASRASAYTLMGSIEFAATPTAGEVVEFYIAPSPISAAANGNPQNIDGADAAAPSGIGTLAELVKLCVKVGNFICSNDITTAVQTGFIGIYVPVTQYGILIVKNESGAAFHSDDVETHFILEPITNVIID